MLASLQQQAKSRKEYISKLFEHFNQAVVGYAGAVVSSCPGSNN
jgi:hypothetical protein